VLGAVYSIGYVSEVLISTYFLHHIRTTLFPTTELIKTDSMITALVKTDKMITAANVYLTVVAIIFLTVTTCFVIMIKKIKATNDTEQNAQPDSK
jgi:heme/copper-type cytochrome/quinol oxidase subunit 2